MLGLVMIVKDEARGIRATLESVKDIIDSWTILDTGSSDGTQAIITEVLAEVPGRLHHADFVDFATTRNMVLDLHGARSALALMLSGDDIVENPLELRASLELDPISNAFTIERVIGYSTFRSIMVMRTEAGLRYTGRTHEVIDYPGAAEAGGRVVRPAGDGDKTARWTSDVELLKRELDDRPDDPRSWFYLGQTYENLKQYELALAAYTVRTGLMGYFDERYEARFRTARVMALMNKPWHECQQVYLDAHAIDPSRAEPLVEIAQHYRFAENMPLCFTFAVRAMMLPMTRSSFFVDRDSYGLRPLMLVAISAFYTAKQAGEPFNGTVMSFGRAAALRAASLHPDRVAIENLRFYQDDSLWR